MRKDMAILAGFILLIGVQCAFANSTLSTLAGPQTDTADTTITERADASALDLAVTMIDCAPAYWTDTILWYWESNMEYLRTRGLCGANAGPAGSQPLCEHNICQIPSPCCSRVSCAYNSAVFSAVFLCKDNPEHLHVPCTEVADVIQALYDACGHDVGMQYVHAQGFTNEGWNMIVAASQC